MFQPTILAGDPYVEGHPPNPVVFIAVSMNQGPNTLFAALKGNATLSRSGGSSASASSGQGGWQVTDRTRRMASTEWLDYYPLVQSMQCLVGWGRGLNPPDVEAECRLLESFEVPVANSYPQQPPIVVVKGPVHHTELFWVCSRLSMDGGDGGQMRNAAGLRTQQHFTIELTQYSPSSGVTVGLTGAQAVMSNLPATGAAGLGIVQPSGRTYTVVVGDNLPLVAVKTTGVAANWMAFALLNGLSNSALLYPGQVLQIPAS